MNKLQLSRTCAHCTHTNFCEIDQAGRQVGRWADGSMGRWMGGWAEGGKASGQGGGRMNGWADERPGM